MEKKLIYLCLLGMLSFLAACSEDEIDFYTGPTAINLSVSGDGTFVKGETDEEKVFQIGLAVQGEVSDRDRIVRFDFGDEHTAEAGVNFEMPMEVVIEAGRLDTIIDCKVFRDGLSEEALIFDLIIGADCDFVGGVYDELQMKLMIGFPASWQDPTGSAAAYYLGECTQAKYAFVFEQIGTLDLTDYQGSWGSGYADLANQLNEILKTDPRLDDDGSTMRFGFGY